MTILRRLLRKLLRWLEPAVPPHGPVGDQIGEHLHAAVSADERAKANNIKTYEARVESMIDDFFSQYGDRDARHHP